MNVNDISSSEEEKVLEFKDPFKFFELPKIRQEEFLLKSDINSIKNLCNAAALSKNYSAVNFFEKLCNSYMFWRKKFRQDFPESYEEIPKDLLIESGINYQVSYWREKYEMELRKLLIASEQGNLRDVKRYLELGADPNMQDINGETALMLASEYGRTEIVQALLNAGADPNLQNEYGRTALMTASVEGHTEIVKALLNAGADPNLQSESGRTALWSASVGGLTETIRALLNAGADPNIQDEEGQTALWSAEAYNRTEFVRILLENGAKPNIQDEAGQTVLMRASRWSYTHTEIVQALLEYGADPNIQDENGWTALIIASRNGDLEIIKALLNADADPNIGNKDGLTPLGIASRNGDLEIIRSLLENGAEINDSYLTETAFSLYKLYFNGYAPTDPEVINYLNIAKLLKEYGASTSNLHRILDVGSSLVSGSLFRDTNDPFLVSDPLIEF